MQCGCFLHDLLRIAPAAAAGKCQWPYLAVFCDDAKTLSLYKAGIKLDNGWMV